MSCVLHAAIYSCIYVQRKITQLNQDSSHKN
jgi:hypothetical protein